jgi:hypothetical protein
VTTASGFGTATKVARTTTQVAALVRLTMSGGRGRRAALGLGVAVLVSVLTLVAAILAPRETSSRLVVLLPTAWLVFLVSVSLTAATNGGRGLAPREQLVAFPVRPAAEYLGGLLLAPVNLSWLVQALTLLAATGWVLGPTPKLVPGLTLTLWWLVTATVCAQALGWLVELSRTSVAATWLMRVVLAELAITAVVVTARSQLLPLLDAAPTSAAVVAALAGNWSPQWWQSAAAMTGLILGTWWFGVMVVAMIHRRPDRALQQLETRRYDRRPDPSDLGQALRRADRASVWRSTPLRRGLLVLGVVPGVSAAVAGVGWTYLVMLPALVAAGAGLLFGVNAFALDGSGALWRASLPVPPRTELAARMTVVAEVCLAAVTVSLLAAVWRAGLPSLVELTTVVMATLATTMQVVARCATWSVHRPFAAALRTGRDQPAPPAAMMGYSVQLAWRTTVTSLVMMAAAQAQSLAVVVLVGGGIATWSLSRLMATARSWDDPVVRARALATVAQAT